MKTQFCHVQCNLIDSRLLLVGFAVFACLFSCATATVDAVLVSDYVQLAAGAVQEKQYDQALKYYRRILKLDPKRVDVRYNVLTMEMRLGNWTEALVLVDALLAQDPANSVLLENKAYILAGQGELDQSYMLYRQVFEAGLRRISVVSNLRSIADRQADYVDSYRWCNEMYRLGQKTADDMLYLIRAGLMSGQADDVAAYIKEYTESFGVGDPVKLVALGDLYIQASFYARAMELADSLVSAADEGGYVAKDVYLLRIKARLFSGDSFSSVVSDIEAFLAGGEKTEAALRQALAALPAGSLEELDQYLKGRQEPPAQPSGEAGTDGAAVVP